MYPNKILIILLLLIGRNLFAQSGSYKETQICYKPTTYDSTRTLEEQFKEENKLLFQGVELMLPPTKNQTAGPLLFSKRNNFSVTETHHFMITDVLEAKPAAFIKDKKLHAISGDRYNNPDPHIWDELIIFVVFVLQEKDTVNSLQQDPIYWIVCQSKIKPSCLSGFNAMITLPYFMKQKQLYENQLVINLSDKSKWLCKEVFFTYDKQTDREDSSYQILCRLRNYKGEILERKPPSEKYGRSFISEKEYIQLDHANKNMKEPRLASIESQKEEKQSLCIAKYGKNYGPLIAQKRIEPGMNAEMCKASWGSPWKQIQNNQIERWYYNWNYILHFEKKVLVKITH